jgi:hypothetical protein
MELHSAGARIKFQEEDLRARDSEAARKNAEQLAERVVALFEHYEVTPGEFETLVVKLAVAHVPGFRYRMPGERGRGRPSSIGSTKEIFERTRQFLEIIPLADKMGLKRACENISKRRGSRCYGVKPSTLRKMVTDAKRASARDGNSLAYQLAWATIDFGITEALFEGYGDEADDRAST